MYRWTFNLTCGKNFTHVAKTPNEDKKIRNAIDEIRKGEDNLIEIDDGPHSVTVNLLNVTVCIRTDLELEKQLKPQADNICDTAPEFGAAAE